MQNAKSQLASPGDGARFAVGRSLAAECRPCWTPSEANQRHQ